MLELVKKSPSIPLHLPHTSPEHIPDRGCWCLVKGSKEQEAGSESSVPTALSAHRRSPSGRIPSATPTSDHGKTSQTSDLVKEVSFKQPKANKTISQTSLLAYSDL